MDFLLRYDKPRAYQDQMMLSIYEALKEKRSILINAPTGIGKTDGSLSAVLRFAVEEGKYVLFLTPKISQHRIVVDSLDGISRKFGLDIKYVDMVGKRNMCINEKINLFESSDFYMACEHAVKSGKCPFYLKAKNGEYNEAEMFESMSHGHNALFDTSYSLGICAYEVAANMAKTAKVIIADYAHILSPYTRPAFLKRISHNLSDAIIIWDEAHNIVDAASSYQNVSLSTNGIIAASRELQAISSSIDLGYLSFVLDTLAARKLTERESAFVLRDEIPQLLNDDIDKIVSQLENAALEYITKTSAKRSRLMHVAQFLRSVQNEDESNALIISKKGSNAILSINCLYPKNSLSVFKDAYANVFMSATLLPLEMYKDLFQVSGASVKNFASPFPKENKMCFVDEGVTTKYESRSEENYAKIAERISGLRENINGNIAVFFPSFDVMNKTIRHMKSYEMLFQRQNMHNTEIEQLIFKLKNSSNSMLFGVMGGSLSEGVDYPNNILKCVVIVGIPLSRPTLELEAKKKYIDTLFLGKGTEYVYTIPGIIRAVQAAGRAVRSERDKAVIVFMDKRYNWQSYKSLVRNFITLSENHNYLLEAANFLYAVGENSSPAMQHG